MVHTDNKILLSVKKKWAIEQESLEETQMNTPKQMKPSCNNFILQNSNCTAFGKGRYRHGKESRGCQTLDLKRDRKCKTQRILNAMGLFCICEHMSACICQIRCTTLERWVNLIQNLGDYYLSNQLHKLEQMHHITLLGVRMGLQVSKGRGDREYSYMFFTFCCDF